MFERRREGEMRDKEVVDAQSSLSTYLFAAMIPCLALDRVGIDMDLGGAVCLDRERLKA